MLIVVGGNSLLDMHVAFMHAELECLDLTLLNTCNVVNMEYVFAYSKIRHIDLCNFDTHNLKKM